MKTAREILWQQHEAARPRLDALRRAVVAQLPTAPRPVPWWATLWREVFVAGRAAWTGVGVAWMVILLLQAATATPAAAGPRSAPVGPGTARLGQYDLLRRELGLIHPSAPSAPRARVLPPSGLHRQPTTHRPEPARV